MPKKKTLKRKYLAVILAISLVVVGGVLWLNYETPYYHYSHPVPIIYHTGDLIGNTGYFLSSMQGTGGGIGHNDVYAFFVSNSGGNTIQYLLGSNQTIALNGHDYTVTAYDVVGISITLRELVAIPAS